LFPCEIKETYYCPPAGKHKNASGKLPDKIKNIKYQVKKRSAGSWTTSHTEYSFVPGEGRITYSAKFAGNKFITFLLSIYNYYPYIIYLFIFSFNKIRENHYRFFDIFQEVVIQTIL